MIARETPSAGRGNVASVRAVMRGRVAVGSELYALAGAQQAQAGVGQRVGTEGQHGPVVGEHAARPGAAVVAAHGRLHRRPAQRSPGRLRSAVLISRSSRSGRDSPAAAHILGKYDAAVIPGMVLISLSRISPSGV